MILYRQLQIFNPLYPRAGPTVTPPAKEAGSAPTRYHRKSTSSTPVNMPAKAKRPSGYALELNRRILIDQWGFISCNLS